MRAAFGLIGVLGFLIAVILFWNYAYLPYTQQVVSSGQNAQSQAQQIAGVDSQLGGRVSQNVSFDPINRGGRLIALQVKSVTPGSSFQTFYGIQPGDQIEKIGSQSVRDIGDEGMASALAYEAYQRQWELVIIRNGMRFQLPRDSAAASAYGQQPQTPAQPAGSPAAAQSPTIPQPASAQQPAPQPAAPSQDTRSPMQRQLDAIRSYGGESAQ